MAVFNNERVTTEQLERLIDFLENNEDLALVHCRTKKVDKGIKVMGRSRPLLNSLGMGQQKMVLCGQNGSGVIETAAPMSPLVEPVVVAIPTIELTPPQNCPQASPRPIENAIPSSSRRRGVRRKNLSELKADLLRIEEKRVAAETKTAEALTTMANALSSIALSMTELTNLIRTQHETMVLNVVDTTLQVLLMFHLVVLMLLALHLSKKREQVFYNLIIITS
ncbi:hypothetical protein EVAR_87204_1 [Eumeta japonica]|uniref:Uncharacterized protein n=1 Tax=Eumeta variegata TaxID=151549 RepID=A0A4C1VV72_EUMVA|nr:hypothetical protein EVAR_87204_1 [Eumeta japonica]